MEDFKARDYLKSVIDVGKEAINTTHALFQVGRLAVAEALDKTDELLAKWTDLGDE